MKRFLWLSMSLCILLWSTAWSQTTRQILVFSKTEGFRHASIEAGKKALEKMGKEKGFSTTFSENSSIFQESELKKFQAVIFLNTTGDVLNDKQQAAFERFIQAGGGYVGIHSATDTEYDWPWYGRLAGAYFLDHPNNPNVQKGNIIVQMKKHWATQGMPDSFEKTDEFYNYKNINPAIKVILTVDENSYSGGKNGSNHPMSWYHLYDGGRAFYTGMGHTDETFSEPLFMNHLWAGIQWASGGQIPTKLNYTKAKPEENRFQKVVLADKLDEPMELTVLDPDRILFIQRKGEVRLFNTKTNTLKTIAKIPVSTQYTNKEGKVSMGEDGLMGLNKDPKFAENRWIYLYYASTKGSKNVLSRFTMKGDELMMTSEKVLLEVPVQREECCHTGGSIAWDKAGNLYLSTGDNTNPHGSDGFSPSDQRPGREAWDAQKSSANTNDLRGKILRIKPQPNGTYTIPAGNLFPSGTPKTRPEIYTMGHRNPFRISVDPKTGYVYWGEVGPDASKPGENRGPAGHDEVGQAKKAGNFGWPHFVGDNKPYFKYDFDKQQSLGPWDPAAPTNTSPNNTGLTQLPPAEKAMIWYPYGESPEFPLVGSGGRNAMAGPVYYSSDFPTATRKFPAYFDGKLFIYEWMRGWIMAVTLDSEGNFASMDRFMPSYKFSNPMDMEFSASGDLYMLEYGSGWFTANDDARLIRIEYNAGNRKPIIQLAEMKSGGALPLTLALDASQSQDPDGDDLKYTWKVSADGQPTTTLTGAKPALRLQERGIYTVELTVSDGKGGQAKQSWQVSAGNEAPVVKIESAKNNRVFYAPNQKINYQVKVQDKEDGSIGQGIAPEAVQVSIDFLAEGFDKNLIAMGHRSAELQPKGKLLIDASDCMACHKKEGTSIGPSYRAIAIRYKNDPTAMEKLTQKIISGGSGVWGETAMAGHPQLSTQEAADMVHYILDLAKPKDNSLPVQGSFVTKGNTTKPTQGMYIVRAAYTDQGDQELPSLSAEETWMLRPTLVDAHGFDRFQDVNKMSFGGNNLALPAKSGSHVVWESIDLSHIRAIRFQAAAPKPQVNALGGQIEIRLGKVNGPLIGKSPYLHPADEMKFSGDPLEVPIQLEGIDLTQNHAVYIVFTQAENAVGTLMVVLGAEVVLEGIEQAEIKQTTSNGFEGLWKVLVKDTPNGDATFQLRLAQKEGKWSGEIKATDGANQALDRIEEKGDEIQVYFSFSGYDLNLTLKKETENQLKGSLMGMFTASADRMQ